MAQMQCGGEERWFYLSFLIEHLRCSLNHKYKSTTTANSGCVLMCISLQSVCPLCSVPKVPHVWSPHKTLILGIYISILIPLIYSSLMSQRKILQVHIQSHHPCLNLTAVFGTLLPKEFALFSSAWIATSPTLSFLNIFAQVSSSW